MGAEDLEAIAWETSGTAQAPPFTVVEEPKEEE